jgi:hypothetical protein
VLLIAEIFVISTGLMFRDAMLEVTRDANINSDKTITLEGNTQGAFPNAESTYIVRANPDQANSTVATVRLDFLNARVIGFKPEQKFIAIGVCQDGKIFTENKLCVDLGNKEGAINANEILGEVLLKFGSETNFSVVTSLGNGFYNGKNLSLNENLAMNFEGVSLLPMTGEEETSFELTNYPLFIGISGFIIFVGAGGLLFLVFRKEAKIKNVKVAKVASVIGVVVLLGGVILIGVNLTRKDLSPQETKAAQGQGVNSSLCTTRITPLQSDPTKLMLYNTYLNKANFPSGKVKDLISINGVYKNTDPPAYSFSESDSFTININDSVDWKVADMNSTNYQKCFEYNLSATTTTSSNTTSAAATSGCTTNSNCTNSAAKYCEKAGNSTGVCKSCIGKLYDCTADNECCTGMKCGTVNKGNELNPSETIRVCVDIATSTETTSQGTSINVATNCTQIKNSSSWVGAGPYCSVSPEGYLVNCKSDGSANGSANKCVNGCEKMPSGTADRCKTAGSSSTNQNTSTETNNSTTSQETSTTSSNTTSSNTQSNTQTSATAQSGIACGNTGCSGDSDCAGYVDNKQEGTATCDQVTGNDISKQKCVKICKNGYQNNNVCLCSSGTSPSSSPTPSPTPPSGTVVCGPMDYNSDKILNYIDMHYFLKVYNKTCNNSTVPSWTCGGQDSNNDKKIDYIDNHAMVSNYFPKVTNCTGMPGGQ